MLRIDKMEEQAFAPLLEEDGQQDDLFEHYRLCIDAGQAPMRIDRFLDTRMAHVSRNRIQNAIKAGSLLVNGAAVKSSYKVKPEIFYNWSCRIRQGRKASPRKIFLFILIMRMIPC